MKDPTHLICARGHEVTLLSWCKKKTVGKCPAYVRGKPCGSDLEKYDGRRHK